MNSTEVLEKVIAFYDKKFEGYSPEERGIYLGVCLSIACVIWNITMQKLRPNEKHEVEIAYHTIEPMEVLYKPL